MFEIKYEVSESYRQDNGMVDENEIRYRLILGSVFLIKENKLISIDWNWIPLVDFALCLLNICDNMLQKTQGEELFEFTESNEKIVFEKNLNNIKIKTSFSNENISMNFEEFISGVNNFYKNLATDIFSRKEFLKDKYTILEYINKYRKMR